MTESEGKPIEEESSAIVAGAEERHSGSSNSTEAEDTKNMLHDSVDDEILRDGSGPGWTVHASYGTGPGWESRPAYGRGNYEPGPGYRSAANYGVPPAADGPSRKKKESAKRSESPSEQPPQADK